MDFIYCFRILSGVPSSCQEHRGDGKMFALMFEQKKEREKYILAEEYCFENGLPTGCSSFMGYFHVPLSLLVNFFFAF